MTFSRPHAGMIGIISLFTGMIAPIFREGMVNYAFPLTNMQVLSYIVFLLLVVAFYLVSTRKWGGFRGVSILIGILIGYMAYQSIIGGVKTASGMSLTDFRWGWIFVIVGIVMLLTTYCMSSMPDDESDIAQVSDGIIGTIGALTLLIFSLLIIGASHHRVDTKPILDKLLSTQGNTTLSGITMSAGHTQITGLVFDRKNDRLIYQVPSTGGIILYPNNTYYTGANVETGWIGRKLVVKSNEGTWVDGKPLSGVSQSILHQDTLLIRGTDGSTRVITAEKDETYTGNMIDLATIRLSDDHDRMVWTEDTLSGKVIRDHHAVISDPFSSITELTLSPNGSQTLAIAQDQDQGLIVLKDGTPAEMIRTGAILASWQSNGLHSIYITEEGAIKHLIYDGVSIGKDFAEVREIFLERNGNGYAYFARELNEPTYCLYTRYRGNLCGISGYMNPRLSADGSTVVFAGKKGSTWSIYRNTDTIVSDTGYHPQDNSGDYAYYDLTNPREYVFIERMSNGKYQVRKDGKIIPKIWDDVGLDTTFGYDGKVIMSAKDESGWHIVEL